MPTLEEELAALKSELSLLQSRQSQHASDIRQLSERINVLQQQIDEQRTRFSKYEQSTLKKFDTLTDVLIQQSNAINSQMNARFDALNANLSQRFASIDARFDQQASDWREKFSSVEHFVSATWGLAQKQESDIREIKERLDSMGQQIVGVRQDMNSRFEQVDQRFERVDQRFDTQEQILHQILERLPKQ